ncbi:bifunctional alpha,alpha-trehalose-phosphate synthase (UDP-forming)/trehalose-phosphatase [uncultured Cytophaga sp.]|uniref:bifunctional alpha,alpha-trehalose-phosphate synthase (UDP-forming)/trehalose-phosphatase n=1 Tax=uncultured Cytophaga sp. TaxID=160238 RepID=UPI002603229B|nr:bifunctional alpha,alpha-trehalose-phosphate synthase (UDP-forming)/trehalose-phosphatase [uncultured Cytophaga sp.]
MNEEKRLIIVAYRIPFKATFDEEGNRTLQQNSGGLVSAILSLAEKEDALNSNKKIHWFGYSTPDILQEGEAQVENDNFIVHPILLDDAMNESYYEGFCNSTIWPISHYYPYLTTFKEEDYDAYVLANKIFADKINAFIRPGDVVWVQDYQLMLLPAMIREAHPEASIGYFHHIPFPTFEIFRLLPRLWQAELLKGLVGADLIGFHTNDYSQYFLRSVQRILGYDTSVRDISVQNRMVRVDTFPISIDYEKFRSLYDNVDVIEKRNEFLKDLHAEKNIFSVDRLDYSKGLIHRLNGFEYFLDEHPEWHGRVVFTMIVVPSRETILKYAEMKNELEEAVGRINGKYGTLGWRPVVYLYRSLSFDELGALYTLADVALITPIRDGMNLVAKEFVATRTDKKGVLILSEMAGASLELSGAILINPTDQRTLSAAIIQALTMDEQEQAQRMQMMQDRIRMYDIFKWTEDYMDQLDIIKTKQLKVEQKIINKNVLDNFKQLFNESNRRLFLLDYDGTLSPIIADPSKSKPSVGIVDLLKKLSSDFNVNVAIISGRDKQFLNYIFDPNTILSAEHGAFLRIPGQEWELQYEYDDQWKKSVLPIFQKFTDRCAGSFIENKSTSLAWHYRNTEKEYAHIRSREFIEELENKIGAKSNLTIIDGDKVVEMKPSDADKGIAAKKICDLYQPDFILSIGDDRTDEDMFKALPDNALTIKVGVKNSYAKFSIKTQEEVMTILQMFL